MSSYSQRRRTDIAALTGFDGRRRRRLRAAAAAAGDGGLSVARYG